MPQCFQLIPKAGGVPVKLQEVDDEMRVHFGVAPDPDRWLGHWYDTIGFRMACGKSYADIREEFQKSVAESAATGNKNKGVEFYGDLLRILDYLEERYVTNSFYSPFK